MDNPYLDEVLSLHDEGRILLEDNDWVRVAAKLADPLAFGAFELRHSLTKSFSWAIPNEEAIKKLVSLSPLVEIAAGTGYWAKLIREMGGDIIAYDEKPYDNHYCDFAWGEVLEGGADKLKEHPGHTLFVGWPPYNSKLMDDLLAVYDGDRFVYVGENGGCTGWAEAMDTSWEVEETVEIPQYWGIHDVLMVFRRLA